MQVSKIEITNFRNIEHSVFNLSKFNCFESKNHTGKTNTMQAIHWLFTGKLLDGSSNDISLKPIGNTMAKVSVELTIEDDSETVHTIKRTYQEHWAKTRGKEDLTLVGHDTSFFIDGLEQTKVNEAKVDISNLLKTNNDILNKVKGLDVYQMLMNPLYLGQIADWKDLRQLIIYIVGDISAEEVFEKAPQTIVAKETLMKYDYKVDKVITYCNQQLDAINKKVIEQDAQIDYLKKIEDIPSNELEKIEEEITNKNIMIKNLQSNGTLVDNPIIKQKEEEASRLSKTLDELGFKEKNLFNEKRDELAKKRNELEKKKSEAYADMIKSSSDVNDLTSKIENLKINEDSYRREIDKLTKSLNDTREKYRKVNSELYTPIEAKVCPHCGGILNEAELEDSKSKWEEKHKSELSTIIAEGNKLKLDLENAQSKKEEIRIKISNLETELNSKQVIKDDARRENDIAVQEYNDFINSLSLNDTEFFYSKEWYNTSNELKELRCEIENLKNNPSTSLDANANQIEQLKTEINELKGKIAQHYVYLDVQKNIDNLETERKATQRQRVSYESIKEAATQFNKTKLDILEARLVFHFGNEVRWILVENNIKEGSWNNVCYPLIVGTNTPYKSGSTSEKIMTGIQMIESIKKRLHLPNLPILIDEIGELDLDSIKKVKSLSQSQIISSKVNDLYPSPTLKTI